jgi:hypothetical protein
VSFNLAADMSRAVRMSSPVSCGHNDNSQHQGCLSQYLLRKQERTQINSIRGMAACGIRAGMLHTNYYCYVTPRPQRIPNAEWTFAEWTFLNGPFRRHSAESGPPGELRVEFSRCSGLLRLRTALHSHSSGLLIYLSLRLQSRVLRP